MLKVITDGRVKEFLETLPKLDQGRIPGFIELFEQNGFTLPSRYLKKLESNLWELRPGNIRLLLGQAGSNFIVVNAFKKKTQKTPRREIETAKGRLKEYQR